MSSKSTLVRDPSTGDLGTASVTFGAWLGNGARGLALLAGKSAASLDKLGGEIQGKFIFVMVLL
jgi:hypothetical protein